MSPGEPLMEFRSVTKGFGGLRVVDRLSLAVGRGEVIALLGRSGCGKSTVLNLAAGLLAPDGGSVQRRAERVGYAFQEPRLIPWRTALENVVFAAPAAEREAREVLGRLGLGEAVGAYPHQLSGGMRQRVSIARMLVCGPELLLMDEPTSALDVALKRELQEALARLLEEGVAGALCATHDPREAARLADRLLLMDRAAGPAREMVPEKPRRERDEGDLDEMEREIRRQLMRGANREKVP